MFNSEISYILHTSYFLNLATAYSLLSGWQMCDIFQICWTISATWLSASSHRNMEQDRERQFDGLQFHGCRPSHYIAYCWSSYVLDWVLWVGGSSTWKCKVPPSGKFLFGGKYFSLSKHYSCTVYTSQHYPF